MTVIGCSAMIELLAAKTHTGDAIARRVTSAQALYALYVLDREVISALLELRRGQKISDQQADAAITADGRIKRCGAARCEVEVFDART